MRRILASAFCILILASCHDRSFEDDAASCEKEYKLEQVVVFSRHNIRPPLTKYGSVVDSITPHHDEWHNWSVPPGELTIRGGISETELGAYFRKWLESEGLIPRNWQPGRREVRFYANCLQRTVGTARCFAAGLAPAADIKVEYKPRTKDLIFLPILKGINEDFCSEARRERSALWGERGYEALTDSLRESFRVLEEVLDFEESMYFEAHGRHLGEGPFEIVDENDNEPRVLGLPRVAINASDALVLQFYEEPDLEKAAFGHSLTIEDWERIARIKDCYVDMQFAAPVVCLNTGCGALKEISRELGKKGRKFTFLCGHDSTLLCMLTALGAEPYNLEGALEKKTPISLKLLFERFSKDGEEYARLRLVYPGWQQLRELPIMDIDNPPLSCPVSLKGLNANEDGYYRYSDVKKRLNAATAARAQACKGIIPDYLR